MFWRFEFETYSGKKAIENGVVNPDYMLWLEAKLSLEYGNMTVPEMDNFLSHV